MKSRLFFCTIAAVLMLFLCACDKEKVVLLFNNQPINEMTVKIPVTYFELGEITHYVVFNPKGFESPYLRVQILKKDTKVQNWGFSIYTAKNLKIDSTKKFFIDEVKIDKKGTFIMSIYYLNDLTRPLVRESFVIR